MPHPMKKARDPKAKKTPSLGFRLFWTGFYVGLCFLFEWYAAPQATSTINLWGPRIVVWALALMSVYELLFFMTGRMKREADSAPEK